MAINRHCIRCSSTRRKLEPTYVVTRAPFRGRTSTSVQCMGSALSILPLDRTTHRGRLRFWTVTSVSDLFHRLEQVAARICYGLHARRVQPSTILQLVLRVESEKVGRALSVISSRHFLRLIDNVGKGEAVLQGERLHVIE